MATRPEPCAQVTLSGWMLPFSAWIFTWILEPQLDGSEIPVWMGVYAAWALATYALLDNMDGKQARKTGTSSALGLLFDHGCDAAHASIVSDWRPPPPPQLRYDLAVAPQHARAASPRRRLGRPSSWQPWECLLTLGCLLQTCSPGLYATPLSRIHYVYARGKP